MRGNAASPSPVKGAIQTFVAAAPVLHGSATELRIHTSEPARIRDRLPLEVLRLAVDCLPTDGVIALSPTGCRIEASCVLQRTLPRQHILDLRATCVRIDERHNTPQHSDDGHHISRNDVGYGTL
jgi:hypothetical protein